MLAPENTGDPPESLAAEQTTNNSGGRFEGKVAVVTGASQGIGAAVVLALAREGASVVGGARNRRKLADTIQQATGNAIAQRCDVRFAPDVQALVKRAIDEFGGIDIMVNNAAIWSQASLVDTSQELWDEIIEVNVRGTFFGCKYAIPQMRVRGGGSIVNVGSINSFVGERLSSAYIASKGAILMLTKSAAAECAEHHIRVNAVCPGAVDTSMSASFYESVGGREAGQRWMTTYQPLTGMIPPDDVAAAVLFLGSNESRSMTGAAIVVDGGLTAQWDHAAT